MTCEEKPKRRRILIISGDESILNEIKNSKNVALCKSLMLESDDGENDDDMDLSYPEINQLSSHLKKTKNSSLICVICGAPALGYNFDAISCESCKSFFRRNALKDPPLECLRQGLCEITFDSRRRCSACRLAKCFKNGMRRDRLIMAEQKTNKFLTKEENLDINLQKNFIVHNELVSSSKSNFFILPNCLQQTSSEANRGLLSPEDLQRIEYIQFLYQKRIELARDGLPWNPSMHAMTFLQKLNSHSVPLIRLLTFFKQIPEFNQLDVDDKVTLIKFNLLPLLCINCTLSYKSETDQIVETDSDVPWDSSVIQEVYGYDGYLQMRKIFESFVHIAQYDERIIQLALITLILTKGFSTGDGELEPILNDGMAVYRAQNYYTELLWKYLETVHGSEKTIHVWRKVITHFITWQTLHKKLRDNVERNLLSSDKNELLPLMKSLFHIS
ncbi:unnamed protein product [Rotaria sp. Silwood1]|nr:unnamed protein product [Rotaria sp. Silwood1]CAF1089186.1 unnamed protein product [Rotaria sp. Silwood1]CAF1111525.1 unnamed protein product [Rotaria sp. Silwood1]CAF3420123.1 unnamed protein product [Rotaria sp. Silwood1]CAF3447358.1 unnamed protein product [Rotaria sp. Silwood1]